MEILYLGSCSKNISYYIGHLEVSDLFPVFKNKRTTPKIFNFIDNPNMIRRWNVSGDLNPSKFATFKISSQPLIDKLLEEEKLVDELITLRDATGYRAFHHTPNNEEYFYHVIRDISKSRTNYERLIKHILECKHVNPLITSIILEDESSIMKYINDSRVNRTNTYKLLQKWKIEGEKSLDKIKGNFIQKQILLRFFLFKEILLIDICRLIIRAELF